jgi:hypothetical protein
LEERVNYWKISGTYSRNPWKTIGSESIYQPRAEPETEGSSNQSLGEPKAEQVEKRKVAEMHLEISLTRMPSGEQANLRTLYAGPPPFGLW